MSPEVVTENIRYTAANLRSGSLDMDEIKTEITLNRFQFKVRDHLSAK